MDINSSKSHAREALHNPPRIQSKATIVRAGDTHLKEVAFFFFSLSLKTQSYPANQEERARAKRTAVRFSHTIFHGLPCFQWLLTTFLY